MDSSGLNRIRRRLIVAAGIVPLCGAPGRAHAVDAALLAAIRQGRVALLMRHTQTTPGVGDPPGWTLAQCASQRNLDDTGIAHAKRIGRWFVEQNLTLTAVRHSPWCRTRDTARLAFGRGEPWAALSNIFEDRSGADAQAAEVRGFIGALRPGARVVLVSHGVLISHVTGVGTAPGEAVVVRPSVASPAGASGATPAGFEVLGRLQVP
jgi:phosphohistidine phosphatase SixA